MTILNSPSLMNGISNFYSTMHDLVNHRPLMQLRTPVQKPSAKQKWRSLTFPTKFPRK